MSAIEKKILIVDDKPENLVPLAKLLEDFDAEIIKATSGNEALAKCIDNEFALALIDVQMPDMDGYETVRIMRQVERTRFLPVIFISAIYSEDQYLIQGVEAGAVDFITKPIKPRILIGKVKIFLELFEQKKLLENEIEQRKITEQSLVETKNELLKAKLKAEESDQLKTAFLANMSHEIRTPLNAIVGFSDILANSTNINPEKKLEFLGYINNSSIALTNIINDILDIAKIEAGQLKITFETINITGILKELEATFASELLRKSKTEVNLILKLPRNQTDLYAETDEIRLRQILSNLLNNAIKFTLMGSIEFGVEIYDQWLEFYVADTGIGIPEDKLALVFERFQRVENDKIVNAPGTGLGLSIVKKMVELLGGNIKVSSSVDKGSRFFFVLPYKPGLSTGKEVNIQQGMTTSPSNFNWNNKNILIAEDQDYNYQYLYEILTPTGANLKWARNGKETVDYFQLNGIYDIILMDIKMPVLNGLEAFTQIRSINKKTPVIAVTAYAMDEDREQYMQYGFNEYITKPVNKSELLNIINSFFERSHA